MTELFILVIVLAVTGALGTFITELFLVFIVVIGIVLGFLGVIGAIAIMPWLDSMPYFWPGFFALLFGSSITSGARNWQRKHQRWTTHLRGHLGIPRPVLNEKPTGLA